MCCPLVAAVERPLRLPNQPKEPCVHRAPVCLCWLATATCYGIATRQAQGYLAGYISCRSGAPRRAPNSSRQRWSSDQSSGRQKTHHFITCTMDAAEGLPQWPRQVHLLRNLQPGLCMRWVCILDHHTIIAADHTKPAGAEPLLPLQRVVQAAYAHRGHGCSAATKTAAAGPEDWERGTEAAKLSALFPC